MTSINLGHVVMTDPVLCLFDMDGTLFDYEGQLRTDLAKLMSPSETMPDKLWDEAESLPYLKARMDLIKTQPGWWRNLHVLPKGEIIYKTAASCGFVCHILTKVPDSKPQAWAEKVQAAQDHFPSMGIDIVGNVKDGNRQTSSEWDDCIVPKAGRYGHILVDDYPKYALAWLAVRPRGLVVMPTQPYNVDCKHPNLIHYDGSNESHYNLLRHFRAVSKRKSGEHWNQYLDLTECQE